MKVAVIGSGAAGCSAAYTLRKHGHEVHLFEASDSIGGRTKQVNKEGFNLPSGALFLMEGLYPRASGLIEEMGHSQDLIPWAGDTQLVDKDDSRYPVNLVKMPSYLSIPVLSFGDKVRLAVAGVRILLTPGPKTHSTGGSWGSMTKGRIWRTGLVKIWETARTTTL
ncbi:MAG: FAD-dependent oxidoreductase [Porticoccaceae bacterium]